MSENEKFEVSSEWSAEAQINTDKYNESVSYTHLRAHET